MFVKAQSQQYRYQGTVTGVRHRSAAATFEWDMSAAFKRAVTIALGVALVLVFVISQLFYWKIMESRQAVSGLQATISLSSQENGALLIVRDRLLTPQRIKAVAAAKLDLHVPGENQIHRF